MFFFLISYPNLGLVFANGCKQSVGIWKRSNYHIQWLWTVTLRYWKEIESIIHQLMFSSKIIRKLKIIIKNKSKPTGHKLTYCVINYINCLNKKFYLSCLFFVKSNTKYKMKCEIYTCIDGLVCLFCFVFNGISTFVIYLMLNQPL